MNNDYYCPMLKSQCSKNCTFIKKDGSCTVVDYLFKSTHDAKYTLFPSIETKTFQVQQISNSTCPISKGTCSDECYMKCFEDNDSAGECLFRLFLSLPINTKNSRQVNIDVSDDDNDDDYEDNDDELLNGPSYFELRGIEEAKSNEDDFIDKYSKKIYDTNVLTNYNMFLLHTNRELYQDYFLHEFPDFTPDSFEEEKQIATQFLEESKEKLKDVNLSNEEKQRIGENYKREFTFLIRKVFAKRANATETINRMYRERAEQRKKDMIEIPKLIRQEVSEYPELGTLKTKASIEKYADKLRKEWKDEKKYNFLTLKQIKYIIEEEIEKRL